MNRSTWRRVGGVVVVALLAMSPACSSKGGSGSPTQPSPGTTTKVVYTAIGASDAVGVGASVPCLPFVECPNGTGYVPVLARRLAETRQVQTTNLGIPAAVLSPEIQALGLSLGRTVPANLVDGTVPFVPRDTTLVTVFAGGNDTNAVGAAVEQGAGGSDPRGFIDAQVRVFAQGLDQLVRGVRDRAPSARILILNLPNMAVLPYANGYSLLRRQGLQRISLGFTRDAINPLNSPNVTVVDLSCDPRAYDAGNYSSDGFHPNDQGYAFIADLMLRAYQGAAPPPSSSCQVPGVPPL